MSVKPNSVAQHRLSHGAHHIIKLMVAAEEEDVLEDAEIVCEGADCWCGAWRTSRAMVNELLRAYFLKDTSEQGKGVERYVLNEDGRRAASDPHYRVPELAGRARG